MNIKEAQELVDYLKDSFLVKNENSSLLDAAETYDDMNDSTEYKDALVAVASVDKSIMLELLK